MKKIYSLVAVLAVTLSASAQNNMVPNGNLEVWTTDTQPLNFSPAPYTANVTKESTIVHGGSFAAKHQAQATTTKIQNEVTGIVTGDEYTISYWYLDNDPNAKTRMWSFWLKAGATEGQYQTLTANEAELRATDYSTDDAQWVLKTVTLVAPAEAIAFRLEARTNAEGAGGGFIYFDDFSIVNNTNVSIKDNNIEGLQVFPNPASNVVNITSSLTGVKEVTIFNMLGKKVLETSTNETVNISDLTSGVYIMNISQDGKTASRKLVKK